MKVNLYAPLGQENHPLKPSSTEKGFLDLLRKEIQSVDADQKAAQAKMVSVATGQDPDLVGLTLAASKAELSFKLLLQVRNKVLEAYQEIMRMQL